MGLPKVIEDLMLAGAVVHEGSREVTGTGQRVLIAAKGREENGSAFKYALNVCKRMGAQLDILYISNVESLDPAVAEFLSQLNKEGIPWNFVQKAGCLKNQIIDYTEEQKGIMFVVTESSENLDVDCQRESVKLTEAWENLKCPLVVVSSAEES